MKCFCSIFEGMLQYFFEGYYRKSLLLNIIFKKMSAASILKAMPPKKSKNYQQ